MKKLLFTCLITCSLMSAQATVYVFSAFLSGPNESPANGSPATGFALVNFNDVANTLQVQALFSGLTGTTTASHIHAATTSPLTGTAGVATTSSGGGFSGFPLGITSGSYSNTLDLTLASSYNPSFVTANGGTPATAEAALVAAMFANKSYLNIHSSTFGGGEIRGFLVQVPEPNTLAFAGLGSVGMIVRAWNKRRARKA